jgi:hypothetical protein
MAATEASSSFMSPLQRIVTHSIEGIPHWITLDPATAELRLSATDAAHIRFVPPAASPVGGYPYMLELTDPTENRRRRLCHTSTGEISALPDTSQLWYRTHSGNPDIAWSYQLSPVGSPMQAVSVRTANDPLELAGPHELPGLIFVTEYLCECGDHWTADPSTICTSCQDMLREIAAQALRDTPPGHHCDGCGLWLSADAPLLCSPDCEAEPLADYDE